MNLMGWHIFLNIINIFIWLLNTLQSSQWGGIFTTALLAWYLPQLQARSNLKDDCHRVLVPKSQVENILQCFGLIFILMDSLGALLSTLGANLVKERFFRDTLYLFQYSRHAFASCCLWGEAGKLGISGIWVFKGQQIAFEHSEDWQVNCLPCI